MGEIADGFKVFGHVFDLLLCGEVGAEEQVEGSEGDEWVEYEQYDEGWVDFGVCGVAFGEDGDECGECEYDRYDKEVCFAGIGAAAEPTPIEHPTQHNRLHLLLYRYFSRAIT